MSNKKPAAPVIAQVKVGNRVVYENPVEMYKIKYNNAIDHVEKVIEEKNFDEAQKILSKFQLKK